MKKVYNRLKARAKAKGIPFTLTMTDLNDLTIPITCPILNIPLRVERGQQTDNSISIDRIDSSKGYTIDNIVIISWKANRLKSNATLTEMKQIVKFYEHLEENL
jgi:hypothetical protein